MKSKKLQSALHVARTNIDSLLTIAQEHGIEVDDCADVPKKRGPPKKHRKRK
jgi:sulfur relay (sulfurtransferase) complex TusBCD TusD component (DsrE family)